MAAGGHFRCPKLAFYGISGHFRSIQNFFTNFLRNVRSSLLIAFLGISDRYTTLIYFEIFDKMAAVGHFGCPKVTFDGISGHF